MLTPKEEVRVLLDRLTDDCSLEDIQYHLFVIAKVRHGLEAATRLGTISQSDAEKSLGQWFSLSDIPKS
jgi:hypothetical protein